jgi:hypothetical protein
VLWKHCNEIFPSRIMHEKIRIRAGKNESRIVMRHRHKWAPGDYLVKSGDRTLRRAFGCFQRTTQWSFAQGQYLRGGSLRAESEANPVVNNGRPPVSHSVRSAATYISTCTRPVGVVKLARPPGDTNKPNLCWFNERLSNHSAFGLAPYAKGCAVNADLKSIKAKGCNGD